VRHSEGLEAIYRGMVACSVSKLNVESKKHVSKGFYHLIMLVKPLKTCFIWYRPPTKKLSWFGLYNINFYPWFSDYLIRDYSILDENERNFVPYVGEGSLGLYNPKMLRIRIFLWSTLHRQFLWSRTPRNLYK